MRSFVSSCLVLAGVAAGLGACVSEAPTEATGEDVAAIIQSRVRVLDAEPGPDLQLQDDELIASRARFPDLAGASAGDILVSGRATGFLRRVRSTRLDGDNVIVATEPASLEDVFTEAHVHGAINGDAPAPGGPGATPGIGTRNIRLAVPPLSLQGRRLSIGENSEIEIVDGNFDFEPDLDFDLTMHDGKLEHLKVLASGESNARLHLRYDLKKPGTLQSGAFVRFSSGVPIVETAPYYAVFWAGYVPIVVAVRAESGRRGVLELAVSPMKKEKADVDRLPTLLDFPAVAVRSPAIQLSERQFVRVSVWVHMPRPVAPGAGGLIVRDSIGSEMLQYRMTEPIIDWQKLYLWRRAPADGPFTVTLGLSGYGEVWFDDLRVERFVDPSSPPPGDDETRDVARRMPPVPRVAGEEDGRPDAPRRRSVPR